ncbi:MAG: hypothetical protein EBT92_12730 [Planctomycetes bacterium]|nr:hypothetical protein [Planctomycetota bacterium]NBY01762.1 hypothetical protein [Planctomycetota bacterium]
MGIGGLLGSIGALIASDTRFLKCPDDYKTKPMPCAQEYFKPDGMSCYKIKSCPPVQPYFKPKGYDDFKIKSIPCVKPLDNGMCVPDGGSGVNFFGLRPRMETHKKLSQP